MFVRFVTCRLDDDSGQRQGVFQAAYRLRDCGALTRFDHDRLGHVLRWFDEHLPRPSRFSRSRRPHRASQAICWLKVGSKEHLARIREIGYILEGHGVIVDMLACRRPGYIVYEDAFQVAAYPFRDTLS